MTQSSYTELATSRIFISYLSQVCNDCRTEYDWKLNCFQKHYYWHINVMKIALSCLVHSYCILLICKCWYRSKIKGEKKKRNDKCNSNLFLSVEVLSTLLVSFVPMSILAWAIMGCTCVSLTVWRNLRSCRWMNRYVEWDCKNNFMWSECKINLQSEQPTDSGLGVHGLYLNVRYQHSSKSIYNRVDDTSKC